MAHQRALKKSYSLDRCEQVERSKTNVSQIASKSKSKVYKNHKKMKKFALNSQLLPYRFWKTLIKYSFFVFSILLQLYRTATGIHKIWPIISFLWRRNSLDLRSKVKNKHFHLEIPFCLPGFKRDPSFFHPCTIHHCSKPNHKTWRDLLDRPCLPNQNLMSFILLMKYCQGL